MKGNSELMILKNICCLFAVFILISSFAGCAAVSGSCLSYGHSCWGAHGKRNAGSLRQLDNIGDKKMILPSPTYAGDQLWMLSRLVNRQLIQGPLPVKLRARMLEQQPLPVLSLSEDASPIKHSAKFEKFSGDMDTRELSREEQKLIEGEPSDIISIPERKSFNNDDNQEMKMSLYKILKNIDEKMK